MLSKLAVKSENFISLENIVHIDTSYIVCTLLYTYTYISQLTSKTVYIFYHNTCPDKLVLSGHVRLCPDNIQVLFQALYQYPSYLHKIHLFILWWYVSVCYTQSVSFIGNSLYRMKFVLKY